MPWTIDNVERHIKGLTDKQKEVWVRVANSALNRCQSSGGSDCEGSAIRQANAVVKRNMSYDEWEEGKNEMSKLYDLSEVEIFRTGKWKGKEYTEEDLKGMVDTFYEFRDKWFKPAVKDGHHMEKGKPALGYINDLKISAGKLLANIMDMPKAVYNAIRDRKYDRVSVEIVPKLERNGKMYDNVLWALSLLGVEVPEVDGLKPLREYFSEEPPNVDIIEIEVPTDNMAEWTTAFINDLPDAAFAVIKPGGDKDSEGSTTPRSLRMLPHHIGAVKSGTENSTVDLAHLRNALARLSQADLTPAEKSKAQNHLQAHADALKVGVSYEVETKALIDEISKLIRVMNAQTENKKEDKEMPNEEKKITVEEYDAKVAELTKLSEDLKKAQEEASKTQKKMEEMEAAQAGTDKVKVLVSQVNATQAKLLETAEAFDAAQKKIVALEERNRKERIREKIEKLRVPAFRFYAEQFYDWATSQGDKIVTCMSNDGVKKELLAEQIVDEWVGQINKATDNLMIQHSRIDTFKRDDTPADENPRVEVDKRVKAYRAEHPEVDYAKALEHIFAIDPDLKDAYAKS